MNITINNNASYTNGMRIAPFIHSLELSNYCSQIYSDTRGFATYSGSHIVLQSDTVASNLPSNSSQAIYQETSRNASAPTAQTSPPPLPNTPVEKDQGPYMTYAQFLARRQTEQTASSAPTTSSASTTSTTSTASSPGNDDLPPSYSSLEQQETAKSLAPIAQDSTKTPKAPKAPKTTLLTSVKKFLCPSITRNAH